MSAVELLQRLGLAALEGTVALVIVALVTRAFPRLPAAARTGLWWLASAKFLLALAPHLPLRVVPSASTLEPAMIVARATEVARDVAHQAPAATRTLRSAVAAARSLPVHRPEPDLVATFSLALAALWALGVAVWMLRAWREHRRLRAVWADAIPLAAPEIAQLVGDAWPGVRWRPAPQLRASSAYDVPLTFGWWRACILVPTTTVAEGGDTARLALLHELTHVRRHDLLLGWVPAFAQALFWFHPLVAWGAREYAQAREEACDADALARSGATPRAYGELLLRYGIAGVLPTTAVASCASRTSRALSRRLQMISDSAKPSMLIRFATVLTLLVAAVAAVPVRVVARPGSASTSRSETIRDGVLVSREDSHRESDFSYLFVQKGSSVTRGMLGMEDLAVLERMRRELTSDALLVRLGNQSYTITDAIVRKRAAELLAPMEAIDQQRAPFEKRMHELDAELSELSTSMESTTELIEQLEQKVTEVESVVDQLSAEGRNTDAPRRQLARLVSQRDAAMAAFDRLERIEQRISRLNDLEQAKCDALCDDADRAHTEVIERMRALVTEAVASGVARPVR